jgi:hypothetical protein
MLSFCTRSNLTAFSSSAVHDVEIASRTKDDASSRCHSQVAASTVTRCRRLLLPCAIMQISDLRDPSDKNNFPMPSAMRPVTFGAAAATGTSTRTQAEAGEVVSTSA